MRRRPLRHFHWLLHNDIERDHEAENSVMRKVNVLEFVSLDGVIQAPGGPEEDTSGGFAYGGWISPHSDPVLSTAIRKQMNMPFDLLIGRRTFDIWAPYWPQHNDIWPAVNTATKYVTSRTMTSHEMAAVRVSKRRYCGKNQQN
jgi:dihydrofolate reductase